MDFEQNDVVGPDEAVSADGSIRRQRDPAATLNTSMIIYIVINLLFGTPLALAPTWFFDFVGMAPRTAADLGGIRWLGASLLAWGISGIVVWMRPEGRSTFVTAGALQLAAAAVALLYTWSVGEYGWSTWFQVVATLIVLAGAVYLGFARLAGRKVLKGV